MVPVYRGDSCDGIADDMESPGHDVECEYTAVAGLGLSQEGGGGEEEGEGAAEEGDWAAD